MQSWCLHAWLSSVILLLSLARYSASAQQFSLCNQNAAVEEGSERKVCENRWIVQHKKDSVFYVHTIQVCSEKVAQMRCYWTIDLFPFNFQWTFNTRDLNARKRKKICLMIATAASQPKVLFCTCIRAAAFHNDFNLKAKVRLCLVDEWFMPSFPTDDDVDCGVHFSEQSSVCWFVSYTAICISAVISCDFPSLCEATITRNCSSKQFA